MQSLRFLRKVFNFVPTTKLSVVLDNSGVKTTTTKPNTDYIKHNSMLFLKTHKSGSTTLIAPFQKYAYLHSLSVMVPNIDFAMFNWPMEFYNPFVFMSSTCCACKFNYC